MSRQQSLLQNEMEIVRCISKMTPEERRKELRREMFRELREMEMERRTRAVLQELQQRRAEKEERDKETERLQRQKERTEKEALRKRAKQREENEKREKEQKALEREKRDQLKKEVLQWKKVMMVEEELITQLRFTPNHLEKEHVRRCEEAELCCLRRVDNEASFRCLISELKDQEQSKRKTLFNNWVGESQTPQLTESLQWLQEKLMFGSWFKKYWDHKEKRKETRRLKAEERCTEWTAFKERCRSNLSEQFDCYTEGFTMSRNSILKKCLF